ncbi:hypothetical protein DPMN_194342 [Dreissena polymorpha]|uniref:Uncharacterized protein n=1 Tax=Dreissena polymorpha TaxID=45954 RepID=A0A9D3Y5Z7_DREPO|nr:hypothetical protein DPMN_194342 [Dreissena polymorpha]
MCCTIADSLGISCMYSYALDTVADYLGVFSRCSDGLGDRLEPSGSLLNVPRRSERLLATSQTLWGSPARAQTV